MRSRLLHSLLGLTALFLAIVSCSPAGPAPQAGGGIGGTGSVETVSSGPVTKFGSVFVSGTEFDNTNTLYCIDHEACTTENRLKIGMVVLVNGTRTVEYGSNKTLTQVAHTITYEETVEGVVQSVAADGLSLVVLGQIVSLNLKTEIDASLQGTTLHVLDPAKVANTLVEISGFVTGDGTILATLIQPHTGAPHYEIEGLIKNHVPAAGTFEVGSLVIRYSQANTSSMPTLTNQSPTWNGVVVFVLGDEWGQGGPGPYGAWLRATNVKPKALGVSDVEDTEVEDFVTWVNGPGDFFINNVHVQTNSGTVFEGGTLGDILVGSHLEVHGPLVGGIVTATKVEFETETELQANVAAIDPTANTLTLAGLSGLTIEFDGQTELSGKGDPRRISDLRSGDHLQIHGRLRGGHAIRAKEVERSDPSSHVRVQGYVTNLSNPWLVLLGSTIDTSAIPESGFHGHNGILGRSNFFAELSVGMSAVLIGTYQGNTVAWTSASRSD
ncbi:MAG: hypothetical protein K2X00_13490 [Nitrospiraceae bacterium]|nr:hypothetical protein [Nitrospiraceae bacterium]